MELKNLVQERQKNIFSLRNEILKSTAISEKSLFIAKEALEDKRNANKGTPSNIQTDSESILDNILASTSEDQSSSNLKTQQQRLNSLKNVVNNLRGQIQEKEFSHLEEQFQLTEKALKGTIDSKGKFFPKTKDFLKNYGLDTTAILSGAATGDPINTFLIKMTGDFFSSLSQKSKERKSQILNDKKKLLTSVKQESPAISTNNFTKSNNSENLESKEKEENNISKDITEIKTDVKKLVKIEEERLAKLEQTSLDNTETQQESQNKKSLFSPITDKIKNIKKSFLDKIDTFSDIFVGVAALANLLKTGSLIALIGSMSTIALPILAAGATIFVGKLAFDAWKKYGDTIMYGFKKDFESMKTFIGNLPHDLSFHLRKGLGLLTKEEDINLNQNYFSDADKLRQKKNDLKAYQETNKIKGLDNTITKENIEKENKAIKEQEQAILQKIIKQNPKASKESIAKIYNSTLLENEKKISPNEINLNTTLEEDQKNYNQEQLILKQKLNKEKSWMTEEEKNKVLSLQPKPGQVGFVSKKENNISEEKNIESNPLDNTLDQNKMVGFLSAKYESNNNPESIAYDYPGGKSYGAHQLSSYSGTLQKYIKNSAFKSELEQFTPGSKEFDMKWKELSQREPEKFSADQKEFLDKTHYNPAKKVADTYGFKTKNQGVQEAIYSGSIQHSGNGLKNILENTSNSVENFSNLSPEEQISAFYKERSKYMSQVKSVPQKVRSDIIKNRYTSEREQALKLARSNNIKSPIVSEAKTPQTLATLSKTQAELQHTPLTPNMTTVNNVVAPNSSGRNSGQGNNSSKTPGPISTRIIEPTLYSLQEKSLKGSVT